jgi:peptide-methionine (S)-S-oxide reductase
VERKATFGAGASGASRRVQAARRRHETRVGYTGGHTENPSYEDVCSHTTGHAEVVEVSYDDEQLSYDDLLRVFWGKHNPTQLNRQGWDIGDQYRSAIFFADDEQREAATRSKARSRPPPRPGRHADRARRRPSTRPRTTTSSTSRSRAARAARPRCGAAAS